MLKLQYDLIDSTTYALKFREDLALIFTLDENNNKTIYLSEGPNYEKSTQYYKVEDNRVIPVQHTMTTDIIRD